MSTPPVVLTVAGTDSGGAAGVAADVATIGHLGAHAACVVTAVTAQDTTAVHAVHRVPPAMVAAQLAAVVGDLDVAAVKTGMLGSEEVVALVAERLAGTILVVDPVLVATSGAALATGGVVRAYVRRLLPAATLTTPNLDEARTLLGRHVPAPEAAARLADLGCTVLLTSGDEGTGDWWAEPGGTPQLLEHPWVETSNDHGTGCTHSSALAALLAHGHPVVEAARGAAEHVAAQLRHGREWQLGRGRGPVCHLPLGVPTRRAVVPAGE